MSDLASRLRPPARVVPAETPSLRGLLTLAVAVVVIAGLSLAQEVLIPITLAVLLSFLLVPLVDLLRRVRLGQVAVGSARDALALGIDPHDRRPDRHPARRPRAEFPRYEGPSSRKYTPFRGSRSTGSRR